MGDSSTTNAAVVRPYHHGDLRHALIVAGLELAREGGPGAIVLRQAAQRIGVSSNAAYRHFEDLSALVQAVSRQARMQLGRSVRAEMDLAEPTGDIRAEAVRTLYLGGRGYVRFALAEPGLFASAFLSGLADVPADDDPDAPRMILDQALDALLEQGLLAPETRAAAFIHLWSSCHGLATLLLGPLSILPEGDREQVIQANLNLVLRALLSVSPSP